MIYHISAKFTAESTKNYTSQVSQVFNRCFFSVFSEYWERNQKFFDCQSHMSFAVFFAIIQYSEAVARRCSVKKVFLEISQNSQENICARVSFLIKLQAFRWLLLCIASSRRLKDGIHLRPFSWEHHWKSEGYKILTSKVLFKRVAECISKCPFSATKYAITQKNSKAMQKTFPYRSRALPSENLCQISWKSNQK